MGWTCSLMMLMSIVVHKPAVVAAHGRRTGRITRLAPNTSEISIVPAGCVCAQHDDDARRCVPSLWSHQMRNNRNPNLRLRDPCRKRQGVRQGARFSVGESRSTASPQPLKPRVSAGFLGGDHHLTAPQSTGTLPRVPDDNLGVANPPTADRRPPTAAHLPGARGSAPRMEATKKKEAKQQV